MRGRECGTRKGGSQLRVRWWAGYHRWQTSPRVVPLEGWGCCHISPPIRMHHWLRATPNLHVDSLTLLTFPLCEPSTCLVTGQCPQDRQTQEAIGAYGSSKELWDKDHSSYYDSSRDLLFSLKPKREAFEAFHKLYSSLTHQCPDSSCPVNSHNPFFLAFCFVNQSLELGNIVSAQRTQLRCCSVSLWWVTSLGSFD